MKTLKSSKWFAVLMLMCLCLASANLLAQERELKTESDGFRWYELKQGDYRGAQSISGSTLIPLSRGYTFICYQSTDGGWFSVLKGGFFGFGACDKSGREIVAPERYDNAFYCNVDGYEYVMVEKNGKKGACDMNGREIIAPRYEWLILSSEGVFKYEDASGKYVSTGVTPPKSGNSSYASSTTTTTTTSSSSSSSGSNGGGTGIVQERELKTESDGFRWYELKQGDYRGVQSASGTTLIPLSRGYTYISYFTGDGGWFSVIKGYNDGGVCVKSGREIVAPGRYDIAFYCNEDGYEYVMVEKNGKKGACDMNGREIIAPRYESLILSSEGVFKYEDASGEYVSTGVTLPKSGNSSYASGTTTTTTTSSSSSSSGSNGGGTVILPPPVMVTPTYPTTTSSSSSSTQTSTPTQHRCGICGGTGRVVTNDITTYGSTATKYCSECGKTVPMYHGHIPCKNCKGKGWW